MARAFSRAGAPCALRRWLARARPDLKSFATLSGHIVLSAHSGIVEIWDKEAYESAVNVDNDDFGLLAEEVMGGRNPSHNELS